MGTFRKTQLNRHLGPMLQTNLQSHPIDEEDPRFEQLIRSRVEDTFIALDTELAKQSKFYSSAAVIEIALTNLNQPLPLS